MKSPAYHLRPNKAADRFALLDAIRRLPLLGDGSLNQYTYISLGGPYLEDFRLMHEFYPDIRMISIESFNEVFKRQKFNRPFRNLKLINDSLSSFINQYDPIDDNDKSIFWLDYTNLDYRCFQDFGALLETVSEASMIKITLRADPKDYRDPKNNELKIGKAEKFRKQFGHIMPNASDDPPERPENLAFLLQKMLQITSQQILPPISSITFIPVSSFYYNDGTWMFTLTGIVQQVAKKKQVENSFKGWEFANLKWDRPMKISVPVLSTKERLHLQPYLPTTSKSPGSWLNKRLGYEIEDNSERTEEALKQYALFHRYSPYFMRVVP